MAGLIADPEVISLIPAQPHDFMKIESEIFSSVILLLPLILEGLLSVAREGMCTEFWLTSWSKLVQVKCGWVKRPSRHDHSCCQLSH